MRNNTTAKIFVINMTKRKKPLQINENKEKKGQGEKRAVQKRQGANNCIKIFIIC